MSPYTLPHSQQRWIALAGLTVLVVLVAALLLVPIQSHFKQQNRRIESLRDEIVRWESVIASEPQLLAAQEDWERLADETAALIPSASGSQAAASVQAFVRRIFQAADIEIKSLEPVPAEDIGSVRRVGVRVVALTTAKQLDQILQQIWEHEPYLIIGSAQVKAGGSGRRLASEAHTPSFQIELEIHGLLEIQDNPV